MGGGVKQGGKAKREDTEVYEGDTKRLVHAADHQGVFEEVRADTQGYGKQGKGQGQYRRVIKDGRFDKRVYPERPGGNTERAVFYLVPREQNLFTICPRTIPIKLFYPVPRKQNQQGTRDGYSPEQRGDPRRKPDPPRGTQNHEERRQRVVHQRRDDKAPANGNDGGGLDYGNDPPARDGDPEREKGKVSRLSVHRFSCYAKALLYAG